MASNFYHLILSLFYPASYNPVNVDNTVVYIAVVFVAIILLFILKVFLVVIKELTFH